jgi:hypothetical protein
VRCAGTAIIAFGNIRWSKLPRSMPGKSTADFISKMGTVEEEADESGFWMEMLIDSKKIQRERIAGLLQEANELVAISVASINTARKSQARVPQQPVRNSALRVPHSALK